MTAIVPNSFLFGRMQDKTEDGNLAVQFLVDFEVRPNIIGACELLRCTRAANKGRKRMGITITATKSGRRGGPAVEIAFDAGTKLDDILAAQKRVFADKKLAKAIG